MKGKKGAIVPSAFQWFLRFVEVAFVFAILYFFIASFVISDVDIIEPEMEIFSERLLKQIYYKDEDTGRIALGVVDPLKLTVDYEQRLLQTIQYPKNKFIASKISLKVVDDELVGYYSKHWYERWKPLAGKELKGAVVGSKTFTIPVTVSDYNTFKIALKRQEMTAGNREQIESEIFALTQKGEGLNRFGILTIEVLKPKTK